MNAFVHAFFNFFASLRLTVVTLSMAMVLVLVGTFAQVKLGLYLAQERYFSSLFVFWSPQGADWKIPVWPGGYLLGGILLLNLIAAHIKRFTFTRKKAGIFIVHAGLILMFVGQFATQLLQVESFMAIPTGETKNYSESQRNHELAIIDVTDPKVDKVVAIPEKVLARNKGQEIHYHDLPFAIKVDDYFLNSNFTFKQSTGFNFVQVPRTTKMDDRDIPSATIEAVADGQSKGKWTVSNWVVEDALIDSIRGNLAREKIPPVTAEPFLGPQKFSFKGHEYVIAMRAQRYYKPFSLTLKEFRHDLYLGTRIPKNFSSRVEIKRPGTGEDRETLIYMNNPLRYGGETYYQASWLPSDSGTVLQVVRNPSWLTPYVACVMVGGGLVIQFLSHLIGFARRRTA
jgi:hypothetical protein